jgi:hypothetical protein
MEGADLARRWLDPCPFGGVPAWPKPKGGTYGAEFGAGAA